MGQLPRPSRQQVLRAGKEIPAERRVGASELRRQGRRQSRRALHRGGAVHEPSRQDRKSTRLNSSNQIISYAVFCLKKKTTFFTNRFDDISPRSTGAIYMHTGHGQTS